MYVQLSNSDLKKILTEKFGEAKFRVIYSETTEAWQERTGKRAQDFQSREQMHAEAPPLNFDFIL